MIAFLSTVNELSEEDLVMGVIDLYTLRDERTVLKNPHKGWYWHYIDCGYSRPRYRDNGELIGEPSAFPGLSQLYLRFDWVDINPSRGVYDFSYIDRIMDEWGDLGYTFSMRMCAFQTEIHRWGNNQLATPDYVRESGAKGFFHDIIDANDPEIKFSYKAWEPDYSDGIFLGYMEETLQRLAERYNNDDRLEYFDIGSFGKYGEGHTLSGEYSEDVLLRHIDITRSAFSNKLVMINDDMLRHNPSAQENLTDYCLKNGIGIRDDSICVAGPARSGKSFDTLRDPRMFDAFSEKYPVDIELAHAELIPEDVWRHGFAAMDAFKRTRATFAGFHDYPGRFMKNNPYLAEYAANRLGYWYRPERIELDKNGGRISIYNLGWAPSYRDYELKLFLRSDKGRLLDLGKIAGSKGWREQSMTQEAFTFASSIPTGEYTVYIGLYDKEKPIKMALDGNIYSDGKYELGKIYID